MNAVTLFGVCAVSFMMLTYALERSRPAVAVDDERSAG
jgi:hypothetical protein